MHPPSCTRRDAFARASIPRAGTSPLSGPQWHTPLMDTLDPRLSSPAALRNRQPILEALRQVLPPAGLALEIASGTGEHALHLARGLPGWTWLPSDPDADSRRSIAGWAAHSGLDNLLPPLALDVHDAPWPVTGRLDAIFCANMIHIAPWSACTALMAGAARHLGDAGLLVTYGPYRVDGEPTAPSNLEFDADLRRRNPAWGLRSLQAVAAAAAAAGLVLQQRVDMPANNLVLVFGRRSAA